MSSFKRRRGTAHGSSVVCGMAACPRGGATNEAGKNALEARHPATSLQAARKINVGRRECRKRVFSAPNRGHADVPHTTELRSGASGLRLTVGERLRRRDVFAPKNGSAGRKNSAPAYRPVHGRGDPQPHAASQTCALFFVRSERPAPNAFLREHISPPQALTPHIARTFASAARHL
jgi:hypothetical protein